MIRVYQYRHELSVSENRRRAIAFHEADAPMVPVYVGADGEPVKANHRGDRSVGCWLFSTGAYLTNAGPLAEVIEPTPAPRPGCEHVTGGAHRATLERVVRYWRLRVERAEDAFAERSGRATDNPRPDEVEALRAASDELAACKAKLADAEEELNPTPEPPSAEELAEAKRREEESRKRAAQRNAERNAAIQAIADLVEGKHR